MTPLLALNMAINLIVAIALWLVWQRDRTQAFARYLSLAGMVALAGPPAYIAWRQDQILWHALGAVVLVAFNTGYLTLLMYGVSHLASRPFSRPVLLALAGALAALEAVLLAFDTQTAQSATATLSTSIGVLALIWLWPQGISERLAGMLLVLLGLSQFTFVMLGDVGIATQAAVTSTLRVCLGFTLVYAAVSRSAARSDRLHERYAQMTENSHQGVAVIRGEEVLYANPALLRIYGATSINEFNARTGGATMPESERPLMRERHRRLMSGQTDREDWEGPRLRIDGSPMRLRFSGWRIDWDGTPAEQVIISDDTKVHDATQALLYSATHDELTGLPNRSALLQRLRQLCRQDGTPGYALLLLDIDRFKLFNDAHGHTLGDEVLKALARRLVEIIAPQTEVMRLGEDEFALLAPHAGSEVSARAVANQVLALLAHPLTLAQREFFIDASMGIALFPTHAREPELLLRAATAAMHEAKRTPGRSLAFAEARFERGSSEVLEQEQALRAGIASDEFSLVYEPKVDAHTGRLIGLEALARWNRPGMGTMSPTHFIPAAERTGLIGALGKLILNQACRQIAAWRSAYGEVVPVAVNVSPVQLLDPDFPALVEHTLHRFDLPPRSLTLEITETAAVAHLDEARTQIRQMRELGVEVALDDFGTGFSSLSMLRSLPLRSVKIDRSLIDPLPAPDAAAVVHAICTLAGVLGLEVVAEGVEREDHAAAARAAGCQVLQGFLFSRPMPPEVAGQWIRERRVGHAAATSLSASLQ